MVKVRPDSPRLAGCVEVQPRMFDAGFPCPQPLTGVARLRRGRGNRRVLRPGRCHFPARSTQRDSSRKRSHAWSARPLPAEVASLSPAPSWQTGTTTRGAVAGPEGSDINLAEIPVRSGLMMSADVPVTACKQVRPRPLSVTATGLPGTCAGRDALLVVHDWDSIIVESEAVLVGFAAALFSTAVRTNSPPSKSPSSSFPRTARREAGSSAMTRPNVRGSWRLDAGLRRQVSACFAAARHLDLRRGAYERLRRSGIRT